MSPGASLIIPDAAHPNLSSRLRTVMAAGCSGLKDTSENDQSDVYTKFKEQLRRDVMCGMCPDYHGRPVTHHCSTTKGEVCAVWTA